MQWRRGLTHSPGEKHSLKWRNGRKAHRQPLCKKNDGGVRAILVGGTIGYPVNSHLLSRCTKSVKEILVQIQLGVAVPMGVEEIVNAVRNVTAEHKIYVPYGLLQIDLKNAFNLKSRAAFTK